MVKTDLIKTNTKSAILNEARTFDKRMREFEETLKKLKPSDLPTIFQKRTVTPGTIADQEKLEAEKRRVLETMKYWCLKNGFNREETGHILHDFEKEHRAQLDDSLKTGKAVDYKAFLERCLQEAITKRDTVIYDKIVALVKLADRDPHARKTIMYKSSKRGERSLLEGYTKANARNDIQKALQVLHTEEFEKAIESLEAYQAAKKR